MPSTIARTGIVIVLLAAVVVAGVLVGIALRSSLPGGFAANGSLVEVHLADGTVYLGIFQGTPDGYLRLEAPAVVLPETAAEGTSYRVAMLSGEPYGLAGGILIRAEQAVLIGAVADGTGIEQAYRAAEGGETPAPSPSPT